VIVRRATSKDTDILIELYKEFHEFHVKCIPDRLRVPASYDIGDLRMKLENIMSGKSSTIIVAELGNTVVGLAEAYIKQDEANAYRVAHKYVHLQSMVVSEAYRRHMFGQKILLAVEQWARENDASEMRLDIWEFAAGPLEFYEKQGYCTLRRTMVKKL